MLYIRLKDDAMDRFCYYGTLHSERQMKKGTSVVIFLEDNLVCGPFEIYEINDARRIAYLKAVPKYGLYETDIVRDDICEIPDSRIKIIPTDTESITGSLIIDGVLRAAFQDKNGTVMISLHRTHRSLLKYFTSELERLNIGYSVGMEYDAYIMIQDREIVEKIFEHEPRGQYHIEYLLGYLSVHIARGKHFHNTDSKYNEYILPLSDNIDPNVTDGSSLLLSERNNALFLCPCFGHMLPVSKVIDDGDNDRENEKDFNLSEPVAEDDTIEYLRLILAPKIIRKLLQYMKYKPGPLENTNIKGIATMKATISQDDSSTPVGSVIAVFPEEMSDSAPLGCGYYISYSKHGMKICNSSEYRESKGKSCFLPLPNNSYLPFDAILGQNFDWYIKRLWNNG